MRKILITLTSVMAALTLTACSASNALTTKIDVTPPVYEESYSPVTITNEFNDGEDFDWYEEFVEQVQTFSIRPVITRRVEKKYVRVGLKQLHNEHPDIFWLNGYYFRTGTNATTIEFELIDGCDEDSIISMHSELEDAADKILSQIPEDSSDYDKALFVHDYIVDNTEYYYDGVDADSRQLWHTAYGCLVNGEAVCQGYAEAFTYLMRRMGIESGICTGIVEHGSHAWNYVKLDDKYYWLDATWDDINSKDDVEKHTYFLFDDTRMLRTRKLDSTQNFAPVCDSMDLNFYVQNNAFFDTYDLDTVSALVAANADKHCCSMMFSNFDAYNEAVMDFLGEGKVFKVDGADISSISYYTDDLMFTINLDF